MKRLAYRLNNTVIVFRHGKTANSKIATEGSKLLQTYSFSKAQFELANLGEKITMQEFFAQDKDVCFDCPFSANMNGGKTGKCYTHKYTQYSGFLSMLRSIGSKTTFADLPELPETAPVELLKLCDTYIRFGTYGEPSLIPLEFVSDMIAICKNSGANWTGYSHQMHKKPQYNAFFMNSAHNEEENGLRSFIVTDNVLKSKDQINCPASKEMDFLSTCDKCGLCSGTEGKGNKSVVIQNHA